MVVEGGVDYGKIIGDVIGGLYVVMWVILIPAAMIGITWLAYYLTRFKHRMLTELVTGGKNVMSIKKFREVKKKEGMKWQVLGTWQYFPPAPAECIKTTSKGSMFCELAYTSDGNYQWKNKRIDLKALKYVNNDTDEMVIKPEETFTTIDRQWFIEELRLAEARRKAPSWLAQHGATMAIGFMFLMALGILIFGAEEMFRPALEAQKNYLGAQTQFKELELRITQVERGVQDIQGEEVANE